jgi:hypothetical protein
MVSHLRRLFLQQREKQINLEAVSISCGSTHSTACDMITTVGGYRPRNSEATINCCDVRGGIHNFRDWCCHLVKNLTSGLLSTITLEVVPFCAYATFPALMPFL